VLFNTSHNMHIFFLVCNMPGPMSSPDTVSNFTVSQWDHTSSVDEYHDHVSTASLQKDCMSQSTLSHYNLANRCGKWSSSHSSPLSETKWWGDSLLKNIPLLIHARHHVSIFWCFFCTLQQRLETIGKVICSNSTWVQATMPTATAGCQGAIFFVRPHALGIFVGPTCLVEADCIIQEKHINDSLVRYFRVSLVCWHACFRQHTCFDPFSRCTFAAMSNNLACSKNRGERQLRKFENLTIVARQEKYFRVFCMIFGVFYSCWHNVSGVDNKRSAYSYQVRSGTTRICDMCCSYSAQCYLLIL